MSNAKNRIELSELIIESLEGIISAERFTLLDRILAKNHEAVEYYNYFLDIYALLKKPGPVFSKNFSILSDPEFDIDMWLVLAEHERIAPKIEIPKEKPRREPVKMLQIEMPKRKTSKFSIYTLVLSAAAVLLLVAMIFLPPTHPIVATLTDSINAEWTNTKDAPVIGDVFRRGELILTKGYAEITFDDGAVVVVEAPAVIELESPQSMFVTSGKISAVVSKYATGFTVNALSASVIDLGTEFGVSVKDDGSCSLSMFKGKANLIAGQKGKVRISQIVNVDEARSVDLTGVVKDIKLDEKGFVRYIDSEKELIWRGADFDLADVIGGGNGFGSGTLGCGVDVNSGNLFTYDELRTQGWREGKAWVVAGEESFKSNGQYNSVLSNYYIDGVFVPDGGNIPCVVSSGGHVFAGCPDTNADYYIGVVNSGDLLQNRQSSGSSLVLQGMHLAGQSYGTRQNPGVFVHANMGVTFDLNAIRTALPGIKVAGFKSLCGISALNGISDKVVSPNKADFWVLVDGVKRFEAIGMSKATGAKQIEISLTRGDRFLTLVTTEGDDGLSNDWCVFAKPTILLESE